MPLNTLSKGDPSKTSPGPTSSPANGSGKLWALPCAEPLSNEIIPVNVVFAPVFVANQRRFPSQMDSVVFTPTISETQASKLGFLLAQAQSLLSAPYHISEHEKQWLQGCLKKAQSLL